MENLRKLASIRVISDIEQIPNADAIELATVDGWKVVVAKNVGHQIGNKVVYCEIDSFLPIEPEFEFLRKTSFKKMGEEEGFRLKSIKMRGQISQGLILPLDDAIQVMKRRNGEVYTEMLEVGKDVSQLLGIQKYEPPIPAELAGKVKGLFPSFLRRTDEERCLSADTIVITENGEKTIKEIVDTKYSGKVLSHNVLTDEDEWQYINNHSVMNNNNDWYELELYSGKNIKVTGNHRIWLPELKCYREVRDFVGEEIVKITV